MDSRQGGARGVAGGHHHGLGGHAEVYEARKHRDLHRFSSQNAGFQRLSEAKGAVEAASLDDVIACPLRKANVPWHARVGPADLEVDTDCIIPKQFLKTIQRTGLGKAAFFELRYEAFSSILQGLRWRQDDGVTERKDFILNQALSEPLESKSMARSPTGRLRCSLPATTSASRP